MASVSGGDFLPPCHQDLQWVAVWWGIVDRTIHHSTQRINRVHGFPSGSRKKEEGIIKIASALFRISGAEFLGFSRGHGLHSYLV